MSSNNTGPAYAPEAFGSNRYSPSGRDPKSGTAHWRLEMLAKGLCPLQDLPTLLQSRAYIVGKSLVYFDRMHATLEYA
jgi:hypothetical protein